VSSDWTNNGGELVPWCYVKGNDCITAKTSIHEGETRKYQDCGECNCLYSWHYAAEVQAGIRDVQSGLVPRYTGCGKTSMEDIDWCYVQGFDGDNKCPYATKSIVDGEDRHWRKCDDCNCLRFWNHDRASYQGCAETRDSPGVTWCFVEGGGQKSFGQRGGCNVAQAYKTTGERRMWRECGSCNCMRRWNMGNEFYIGCAKPPGFDYHWCYVQASPDGCNTAKKSEYPGEKRWWRECKGCTCQFTWNYKNAVYSGCVTTEDYEDGKVEWCYVQGGPACKDAKQAKDYPIELRMWRECGVIPVTCGDVKQKFKDNKCCGNPNKMFREKLEPIRKTRRLFGSLDGSNHYILEQMGAAIRQVKASGVSAHGLEREILTVTKQFFDDQVALV